MMKKRAFWSGKDGKKIKISTNRRTNSKMLDRAGFLNNKIFPEIIKVQKKERSYFNSLLIDCSQIYYPNKMEFG